MNMPVQRFAFILYAIDPELLYPWLGARFETNDLEKLRRCLGVGDAVDAWESRTYTLSPDEAALLCDAFGIQFDSGQCSVTLHKDGESGLWGKAPYLFHTGYELPLMLQGRKKFAHLYFYDHPDSQALKARYDRLVEDGVLHAEYEAVDLPQGGREVSSLYTVKGEEWRIPAMRLVLRCSGLSGGWNEHYERLEGMLMGYEDSQNDWWLDQNANGEGVVFGLSLRCAVSRAGLAWVEHAGMRALPPVEGPSLAIASSRALGDAEMRRALQENPEIEAFVQFNIGAYHLMHLVDLRTAGPYRIPTSAIPEINSRLTRLVRIVMRRD